ncbi:MAG: T9SS type A sorting domain-containing protein [Bacteroidetes bacterium]|nr:T9SS type A sorting domain-containing protein [Bacteroidota bacterium]
MIRSFVLLIVSLCIYSSADAQINTWITQNPSNIAGYYRAIQMVSPTTMFMVGDKGTVARSTDAGATIVNQSIGSQNLYAVNFIDSLTGMTVGSNGAAYKTTDGGQTWKTLNIGITQQLFGVLMVDQNTAIICGGTSSNGLLRITRDGGKTWSQYGGELGFGFIRGLRMLRPDFIVFVGDNGAFYVSHDTAHTFVQFQIPYQNTINDLCFLDDQHIVAVGSPSRYMIGSPDQGVHWHLLDSNNFTLGGTALNRVDSKSPNSVVAVGDYGEILYSFDGGNSWNRSYFGSFSSIKGVSMYSDKLGMVVGQDGVLMRTTDGGATWEFIPRKPEIQTFRTVKMMPDGKTGFAAGGNGAILITSDSGHTWLPTVSGTNQNLLASILDTDGRGFIVGEFGTMLSTTNAGASWKQVPLATTKHFRCITQASRNAIYIGGDSALFLRSTDGGQYWTRYHGPLPDSFGINGIAFFDSSRGMIASPAGIFKTTDAGISWRLVMPTTDFAFNSIAVGTSPTHAYAVGIGFGNYTGAVAYTVDGGDTWNATELQTVSPKPPQAIYTADGYHATMVGRNGLILHTTDPTSAWTAQTTPTSNDLFGIAYGTTHAGWSCGFRGTILRIDTDEEADVKNPTAATVSTLQIERVYPNPAVNRIHLLYRLDQQAPTTIQVFDLLGARVLSSMQGLQSDGEHACEFNLGGLSTGTYILVVEAGNAAATTQIVVTR